MALNNDTTYPPIGFPSTGPYRIHQDWCIGDSLNILNANFQHFDTQLLSLSSTVSTLSSSLVACCGSTGPTVTPTPVVTPTVAPPTPPPVVPKIVSLVEQTLGGGNTKNNMFIASDGTLRVVGQSSNGELGFGVDTSSTTIPRVPLFEPQLFPGENISSVTPQGNVTFVITTFGRLYGAGQNNHYQLGLGDVVQRSVFTRIYLEGPGTVDLSSPKTPNFFVKKVVPGSGGNSANITVFALTNNGDVYAWGRQKEGQAGLASIVPAPNGNANYIFRPQKLALIGDVKDIVSGGNSAFQTTFFHKNDNTLWVTGENTLGSAGIGNLYTAAPNNIPVYGDIKFKIMQVTAGSVGSPGISNNVRRVYCGGESSAISSWVVTDSGYVFGTGNNNSGQAIGATSTGNKVAAFTEITLFRTAGDNVEFLAGHSDSKQTTMFALINTGTPGKYRIKGWGNNTNGPLGVGNYTATILNPTSPSVAPWEFDGAGVNQIVVAGDDANKTTLVLDTMSRLWTTGLGTTGLLGNGVIAGATSKRNTFQRVSISPGYGIPLLIRSTNTSIPKYSNFLVLVDTGKVLGWGFDDNSSGQLAIDPTGKPASVPSFVQITL